MERSRRLESQLTIAQTLHIPKHLSHTVGNTRTRASKKKAAVPESSAPLGFTSAQRASRGIRVVRMSDLEFPIVSNATALGPRGSHFPPTSDCYLLKIGPQVLRQILAGAEQGHEVTFKIPEDGARVTTLNVGASEYRLQHNKTDPHYVYDETRQCSQCSTLIAAGAADCAACGADDSALQAIWQHSGLVHGMFTSKSDADGVASQVKQKRAAAKSAKAGDSTSTAVGAGAANSPVPAADSPRLAASVSGTVIPPPLAASSSATRLPSLPSTLRREAGGKLKGLNPSQLGNVAADGGIGAKDSGIAAGAEGESGGGEAGSNSSSSSSSAAAAAAAAAPARAPPKSKTTSKVGSLLQQITGGKPAAAKKGARAKAAGAGSGGVAAHGTHPTSAAAHAAAAAAQMTDGGGAGDVDSGGEGDGEEGATSSGEGGDVDAGAGAAASGAGAGSAPSLIGKKRGRPTGSTAASREGAASAKRMLDAAEASLRPTAIIEARLKDLPDRPRFGLPLSSTTSPAAMEHACAPVRNVKQCMRMSGWVRKHTLQYEALRKWTEKVSASFTEIEVCTVSSEWQSSHPCFAAFSYWTPLRSNPFRQGCREQPGGLRGSAWGGRAARQSHVF